MIVLDDWQEEVLNTKGNKVVCSGRQTGKSTVVSRLAGEFVVKNPNKQVLIVSVTEDQAIELLLKVLWYLEENYKPYIKRPYTKNVLKQRINLTNGSIVRTKAVGQSGIGVRGFTIDMLIADEAAFMNEEVWAAITPMLLTTGGDIILLSTPHGKKGYFYDCYHDDNFKVFHVNSVEVMEKRPITESWNEMHRIKANEFIKSEKKRMTEMQFGQEYLGLFIDDLQQFFPDEHLKSCLIQEKQVVSKEGLDFVLGVDIGRMGGDDTVFAIFEKRNELIIQREQIVWRSTRLDQISQQIIDMDKVWNFQRIYLDDGGIGIGVFDTIYGTPGFKKRVIGINNAKRIYDYDKDGREKYKKLMKEEIYTNLLLLMEKKKILLLDDSETFLSLKSVQYEYLHEHGGAQMRIFSPDHSKSHIVEAIARAAYISKEKLFKLNIHYV